MLQVGARLARVLGAGALVAGLFAAVGGAAAANAAVCDTTWSNPAGGNWATAANWSSGAPDGTKNACITLAGTYTVTAASDQAALSLTVGAGSGTQTLAVAATCTMPATLSVGTDSTIKVNGVVVLTDGPAYCFGDAAKLKITAGTLTNNGRLESQVGTGTSRYLLGNIANKGTLTVDALTHASGGTITNTGTVAVADGARLSVETSTFVNNGGTVAATGSGSVYVQSGTYTQGNGTTSGTAATPVRLLAGTLRYTGSGASTITQSGIATTLYGNIAAGQTLVIAAYCNQFATVQAPESWTNAGTIDLTDTTTGCGDYRSTLNTYGPTFTNVGTIDVMVGGGTSRTLAGVIVNTGTVDVEADVHTNESGTFTNSGTVGIADGRTFFVDGGDFFSSAGTISATGTGSVLVTNGEFTQGNGTTAGTATAPVVVDRGRLHYAGTGASTITQRGYVTVIDGDIAANQTLTIAADCGNHSVVTAPNGLANAGTINMYGGATGCGGGYDATLSATGGVIMNTGTIHVMPGASNEEEITGTFVNDGTLTLDAGTNLHRTGTYASSAGAVIEEHVASATSYGRIIGVGGIQLAGTLAIVTEGAPAVRTKVPLIACGGGSCETGAFATITGRSISGGFKWGVQSKAKGTTLVVKTRK